MKSIISLCIVSFLFFVSNIAIGQTSLKDPDVFLVKDDSIPKVMLVGSFHFAYYGADSHKTSDELQINVLDDERQKQMEELVNYIAAFKPTKIAIEENVESGYAMRRYKACKSGSKPMRANEIDQICFRLLDRFNLDTLYGVNDWGLVSELWEHKDSSVFRPWIDSLFYMPEYFDPGIIDDRFFEWYAYQDTIASQLTLLEYFKYLNDEKCITRGHGHYLVGFPENDTFRSIDAMVLKWYSRNLRIFRNIQKTTTSPDDRILVLIGAGHLGILTQQFESTPEFELVRFNNL